ncbi:hypothetical protein BJX63DRAFT_407193 [Aspergillus granulosus]|uniref:Uncharacterized protein n=1 Tax=Aspergillus granulosus TaxID=176169 RepID=A0ABR4H171_9EURO
MSSPPARQHPPVEAIQFDHQLCADLHNKIFQIGWVASAPGRTLESCPSQTWWEYFSPPTDFADRLDDGLVQFLKSAYFHKDAPEFFYFLSHLNYPKWLLDDGWVKDRGDDRYLLLYPATGFKLGDEMGLIFDQHTSKAAFVEDFEDMMPVVDNGYGWKPLEDIYNAYLEMIGEGKVEVSSPDGTWTRESHCDSIGPWLWHEFTDIDVQKSALAFKRLIDAIEERIPSQQPASSDSLHNRETFSLPWADSSTLDAAKIHAKTFARAFCEETAKWDRKLSFRYIAPGIRVPTVEEFIAQPFYESYSKKPWYKYRPEGMPVLLFATSSDASPQSGTWLYCEGKSIPAGVYTNGINGHNRAFQNSCRLILPFKFGSNGCARLSDLEVFGMKPWDDEPDAADVDSDLYQPGYNGFTPLHSVQLHKVLLNWAERVESGDWDVTEDGVGGGLDKFCEADTEDGWKKYWIPLTW